MQITSVRGAVVAVAAGAAVLGAPAIAQAAGLPLEPATPQEEVTTTQHAGPVLALWDPQTGSSSLSSNVNARGLCIFQSISATGGLDCFTGAQ
ncbi:hypothetical protein [Nocardia kruczakiae]|uniref:hypothetical protein n=1 Tax=Nocardia kruczakiae TaxID=261477 RepID=UPI0007A3BC1A|nr:hypothetical protein [Nocardia kruczakiae]